ncbi:MAG: hypothetical protein HYR72_03150 [Deltaproteobacteria bacterium]|nr:hypothetical protein [Deltaproteobacteria bacterium]MBI3390034.1 hypothetical protein [Deltaproteobacteria bacterium]
MAVLSLRPSARYTARVRCRICHEPAGWLRRRCETCAQLAGVVAASRGLGLSETLDAMIATGASPSRIEAFLAHEPAGAGTIRDQIVADMTNQLAQALGQTRIQTAAEVKRLRERGAWQVLDKRPEQL